MSKHRTIPQIQSYMTTSPRTIDADRTMADAHGVMREHQLRHLPVVSAERLVGVISVGDLHLVETLRDVDPSTIRVEDVMTRSVYSVSPDAPLDGVVQEMARHKYGSVVVVDNGHVVGIFTTVDACRAFADTLQTRLG